MNPNVQFFLHWYWISLIFHFLVFLTIGQMALIVRVFRKSLG